MKRESPALNRGSRVGYLRETEQANDGKDNSTLCRVRCKLPLSASIRLTGQTGYIHQASGQSGVLGYPRVSDGNIGDVLWPVPTGRLRSRRLHPDDPHR